MAPIFTYGIMNELQPRKSQNITTNNKGTRVSWDILRKVTSIIRRDLFCNFINITHVSSLRKRYAI